MKEWATEQENEIGEKHEEAGKPKTGFTPSEQDDQQSKELKKAVTEQENKLGAKIDRLQ